MSKVCQVTGRKRMVGSNVSHSKRHTKRTFDLNLKTKRFWSEVEQRYITLRVSCKGMRTEQKASGVPGMSRYITTKNKKNTPERLERMKYNPFLKKVTLHREIK